MVVVKTGTANQSRYYLTLSLSPVETAVPFARSGGTDCLIQELRPGPACGSIGDFLSHDRTYFESWTSFAAMLDDVAQTLENGGESDGYTPGIEDGCLTWTSTRWDTWRQVRTIEDFSSRGSANTSRGVASRRSCPKSLVYTRSFSDTTGGPCTPKSSGRWRRSPTPARRHPTPDQ
jgi:hypothetical protein